MHTCKNKKIKFLIAVRKLYLVLILLQLKKECRLKENKQNINVLKNE